MGDGPAPGTSDLNFRLPLIDAGTRDARNTAVVDLLGLGMPMSYCALLTAVQMSERHPVSIVEMPAGYKTQDRDSQIAKRERFNYGACSSYIRWRVRRAPALAGLVCFFHKWLRSSSL